MTTTHVLDQLPLWIEGDLKSPEMAAVEAHLAECPRCQEAAAQLRTSQGWLREALAPPFDPAPQHPLRRRVMDRIRAETPTKPAPGLVRRSALLAACTASLLIGFNLWRQSHRIPSVLPLGPAPPEAVEQPTGPALHLPLATHGHPAPRAIRARPAPRPEAQAPPQDKPACIEFQTADPSIRIIWLAQSKPQPGTRPSLEDKS